MMSSPNHTRVLFWEMNSSSRAPRDQQSLRGGGGGGFSNPSPARVISHSVRVGQIHLSMTCLVWFPQ